MNGCLDCERRLAVTERVGWSGLVAVYALDAAGDIIEAAQVHNEIFDDGKDLLVESLAGTGGSIVITHVALGSDNTAPPFPTPESGLGAEFYRKQVTGRQAGVSAGQWVTDCKFNAAEGNGTIEELGWFVQGTDTLDSGILIARTLYSFTNTTSSSLLVQRTDTIT